ncbi:restriction endonuclease subunit S [Aeromonas rivipollensis]
MARKLNAAAIPDGWKYDLLDKFATRCSGHTPSKTYPEYWDGGIKWISLTDSYRLDKGYVYETDKEISLEGIKNSSAELHPAETVVLSRDAGIGKSGVMAVPMAVSQHFIAWKCDNQEKLNSWFLYNWLQLNKAEFERQAVGSTIKTIGLPYFKKLKIAMPPYPEQHKIAKILSTWDKAISTTEQLLANSQQQKKALMQQLLTGKKRLLDKNGVRFSGEWKKVTLDSVADMNSGGTPKSSIEEYYGGDIPWVSIADMTKHGKWISSTERNISELGLANSSARLYPENTILYAMYASIGECSIAKVPLCSSQAILGIRPKKSLYFEFLYFFLVSLKDEIKLQGQQGTQANLNAGMVKGFSLRLPCIEEQQKIADVLSTTDQEIAALQQKLDALKQEKKALMQQLLTGKRRVKVEVAA